MNTFLFWITRSFNSIRFIKPVVALQSIFASDLHARIPHRRLEHLYVASLAYQVCLSLIYTCTFAHRCRPLWALSPSSQPLIPFSTNISTSSAKIHLQSINKYEQVRKSSVSLVLRSLSTYLSRSFLSPFRSLPLHSFIHPSIHPSTNRFYLSLERQHSFHSSRRYPSHPSASEMYGTWLISYLYIKLKHPSMNHT